MRMTLLLSLVLYFWLCTGSRCCSPPSDFEQPCSPAAGPAYSYLGLGRCGRKCVGFLCRQYGTATADRLGHWSVYLPPHAAGGPFEIKVAGSNEISLTDLLIGDVWFASGQSNMEMPLNGFPGSAVIKDGAQEISAATQPQIRLLYVPKHASALPARMSSKAKSPGRVAPLKLQPNSRQWLIFSAAIWWPPSMFPSAWSIPPGAGLRLKRGPVWNVWLADASLMPTFFRLSAG